MDDGYVHEVPGGLKQLARLVARAFYTVEDALIVDMLVRNPCKSRIIHLVYLLKITHLFSILFSRHEGR